jgi:hypothetical protein
MLTAGGLLSIRIVPDPVAVFPAASSARASIKCVPSLEIETDGSHDPPPTRTWAIATPEVASEAEGEAVIGPPLYQPPPPAVPPLKETLTDGGTVSWRQVAED